MEIIENIALISINETLFFQLISFLLFLFVLNRIMIRPIRETISEREFFLEKIEKEIIDADRTYEELAGKIHTEDEAVRQSAFKMRDKLENQGQDKASELLSKTRIEINSLRVNAQLETNQKIEEVRQDLQSEIDAIAGQMIGAVLGRRSAT